MLKNIKDYESFKVLANTEFKIDGKTTIKEILVKK